MQDVDKTDGRLRKPERELGLNPKYKFENFVVGKSNAKAYAASVAVSFMPEKEYLNPLLLYGTNGVGKTHLLQGIVYNALVNKPEINVLYATSERFVNGILDDIKVSNMKSIKEKYTEYDMLLVDNIQDMIGKKTSIQTEIFRILNDLCALNKQIVLASDRSFSKMLNRDKDNFSRFKRENQIIIDKPDYEMRMQILKEEGKRNELDLTEEVFEYIATNIVDNVRELEGALNKIRVYKCITGEVITLDLVKSMLEAFIKKKRK